MIHSTEHFYSLRHIHSFRELTNIISTILRFVMHRNAGVAASKHKFALIQREINIHALKMLERL